MTEKVGSTSLSPSDLKYFESNYKVRAATVSTIEEAEIILLGEDHTIYEHKMKELWLLSKLARENDLVFLERAGKLNIVHGSLSICPGSILETPVFYEGWDSLKDRHEFRSFYERFEKNLNFVEALIHSGKFSHRDLLAIQESIDELSHYLDSKMKLVEEKQFSIPPRIQPLISLYHQLKKIKKTINQVAQTATEEKLKALCLTSIKYYLILLKLEQELFLGIYIYSRNQHLAQTLIASKGNQRKWCIAGKGHLKKISPFNTAWGGNEGVDHLLQELKGKKYVILCPTKSWTLLSRIKSAIAPSYLDLNPRLGRKEMGIIAISFGSFLLNRLFDNLGSTFFMGGALLGTILYFLDKERRIDKLRALIKLGNARETAGTTAEENKVNAYNPEDARKKMHPLEKSVNSLLNSIPEQLRSEFNKELEGLSMKEVEQASPIPEGKGNYQDNP